MNRLNKIFLALLITAFLITGCDNTAPSDDASSSAEAEVKVEEAETPVLISGSQTPQDFSDLNVYRDMPYAFMDGVEGYVRVYTAAEQGEDGDFYWDDGQDFAVEVFDGTNYFYPFERQYAQNGMPMVTIFSDMDDATHHLIIDYTTSAGMEINHYQYDAEQAVFVEDEIYQNSNINLFYS